MGNVLCREKRASPRRVYTKGSGPTVYDQNISSNSQLAHPNTKIETPNLTMMNSSMITLDPRIFDDGLKTPVPPPRKKRTSTLRKGSSLPPASTFSSTTSNDGSEYSPDKSHDELQSSTQSLPSRKLKVGNKKSDKILGESLSDHLSDEPIDSPSSRGSAAADEVDKSATTTMSDQKLSFLLNMLEEEQRQKQANEQLGGSKQKEDEDDDDEEFYKNKQPIEEPLFVARKKVTRHICDDDDHIHGFIDHEKDPEHDHDHNHEDHDHPAPKKPERDFSKFQQQQQKSEDEVDDASAKVTTTVAAAEVVKVRKTLSRENLPQPPEVPAQRRSTGANEFISGAPIKVDEIATNVTTSAEEVKKSPRPVNRTISLNLARDDHQHQDGQSSHDDLSPQTAPILITTTKSIVDSFNFVPSCPEIHPVVKSDSVKHVKFDEPTSAASIQSQVEEISESASTSKDDDVDANKDDDVTRASANKSSQMNEIIEEIYSRNSEIMREFHSYLEPPKPAKKIEELLDATNNSEDVAKSVKIDDNEKNEHVQVIAVKSVETSNHHENSNDVVRPGVSEQEAIEDDDDEKRRYSDSFESTDEDELDSSKRQRSRKFNKNTTTLVSIQIKAGDDDNATVSDDNDNLSAANTSTVTSESFSDLPIFKSIVEETITNTREFIREKSPDHSTLLKLLNDDKPSKSTSE